MYYFKNLILLCFFGLIIFGACGNKDDQKTEGPNRSQQDTTQRSSVQVTGETLLQASLTGRMEIVRKASEQGISIDTRDRSGRTPLMLAAYNGHTEVVQYLLGKGAKPSVKDKQGRTPLIFAASGPNSGTVKVLLDNGADPNAKDEQEGWTALMWAASEGNKQVVQLLLDRGADPTLQDKDQETARDFASSSGHTEVVKLLQKAEKQN